MQGQHRTAAIRELRELGVRRAPIVLAELHAELGRRNVGIGRQGQLQANTGNRGLQLAEKLRPVRPGSAREEQVVEIVAVVRLGQRMEMEALVRGERQMPSLGTVTGDAAGIVREYEIEQI